VIVIKEIAVRNGIHTRGARVAGAAAIATLSSMLLTGACDITGHPVDPGPVSGTFDSIGKGAINAGFGARLRNGHTPDFLDAKVGRTATQGANIIASDQRTKEAIRRSHTYIIELGTNPDNNTAQAYRRMLDMIFMNNPNDRAVFVLPFSPAARLAKPIANARRAMMLLATEYNNRGFNVGIISTNLPRKCFDKAGIHPVHCYGAAAQQWADQISILPPPPTTTTMPPVPSTFGPPAPTTTLFLGPFTTTTLRR
jgi:hypothetical protein